jgi:NitT/TauT family transport system permease protein
VTIDPDRLKSAATATGTVLVIVIALEVLTSGFGGAPVVLDPPSAILRELVANAPLYAQHTWVTLLEILVGFVVAGLLGVALAVAIVYSRFLQDTLYPIVLVLQVVPKVAIAPLLVVFLGFGPTPKIVIAVLIAFFPVVIDTVVGMRAVDREMLELVRVLNGSRLQEFTRVRFPFALPFIFSGLKVAMTFAVIGVIIGEFIGANSGLGYLLILANSQLQTEMSYAALTILSVIGIVLFGALSLLERIIVPWADHNQLEAVR